MKIDRTYDARARVLRGLACVALSAGVFQLWPLVAVIGGGGLARIAVAVAAFVLAASGSKAIVVGAFELYDAWRAARDGDVPLPHARARTRRRGSADQNAA
jgi:hypothetical protein